MKLIPPEEHGYTLLSLLDDRAASQLSSTGISLNDPIEALWERLDDLFACKDPPLVNLNRFRTRSQLKGETIDEFAGALRELSCIAFTTATHEEREKEMLYQFCLGVSDPGVRAKFVRKTLHSFGEAVMIARSYEVTLPQTDMLKQNSVTSISRRPPLRRNWNVSREECRYCQRFGVLAQHCGHNPPIKSDRKSLCSLQSIPCVSSVHQSSAPLLLPGQINGTHVKFLIDSGASCSLVSTKLCKFPTIGDHCNTNLVIADGSNITPVGSLNCDVTFGHFSKPYTFLWQISIGTPF